MKKPNESLISRFLKPNHDPHILAVQVKALVELAKLPTTLNDDILAIWPTLYFNLRNDEKLSLNAINFSIVANDHIQDRCTFEWALEHLQRILETTK